MGICDSIDVGFIHVLPARLDLKIIHRAETIAAYGGAGGAVKEEVTLAVEKVTGLRPFQK
jgi:hypothetical protein